MIEESGKSSPAPGRVPPAAYVRPALRLLALCTLLFLPASGAFWAEGVLYVALYALWSAVTTLALARRSPGLLRLRELERPSSPHLWDRAFSSAGGALLIATLLLCGADAGGGLAVPRWPPFVVIALSYLLAGWALLANPFAAGAALVREGQAVCEAGPYRKVRHPIYLAGILFFLATPAALGSLYAYLRPVLRLLAAATASRAALEDSMLRRGLPGYDGYAARVPYRLLPGIW